MKHPKIQQLGLERIYRLFELAEQEFENSVRSQADRRSPLPSEEHARKRSKRYVQLALEISKKVRVRIPDPLKTKFCKKCKAFLVDGKNAKISKDGNVVIVKCEECGFARKTGRKQKVAKKRGDSNK